MSYLVLARKWRPRSFDTLVGQDHVVRALTHALSTQRLHHAWLFTGTRGVGKTTLSRILAKSLNCETGITATPCGVCQACTEIDSGRFVDYVELDAASNRGVDEMTQLLEQAVYAPGAGRFKVYMIDEVHMLSGHAFNAMLKTLEEPPPHVKFILATTDPQKIPVTVLSRCLQFNLKQMTPDAIVEYLQHILAQEDLAFETPALQLLARAASGSMRDALSLTDQAIAYSAGSLTQDAIQGMLGTIDQRYLVRLLDHLLAGDGQGVLGIADELTDRGLSYAGALADLASLLSQIAILQRVPDAPIADVQLAVSLQQLAQRMHADLVQLFYTVAVHSRHELSLAPDEYAGFVMACLRMLAFVTPDVVQQGQALPDASDPASVGAVQGDAPAAGPDMPAEVGGAVSKSPAQSMADATPEAAVASPPQTQAQDTQATAVASKPVAVLAQDEAVAPDTAAHVHAGPGQAAAADVPAWEDAPTTSVNTLAASSVDVSPQTDEKVPVADVPAMAGTSVGAEVPATVEPSAGADKPDAGSVAADVRPVTETTAQAGAPSLTQTPVRQQASDFPVAPASTDTLATSDDEPPAWLDEGPPDEAGVPNDVLVGSLDEENPPVGDMPDGLDALQAALPQSKPSGAERAKDIPLIKDMTASAWPALAAALPLTGWAAELARQCEWLGYQGNVVHLRAAILSEAQSLGKARLETVLSEHFHQPVRVDVEFGQTGDDTAHAVAEAERAERQRQAESAVHQDTLVQAFINTFDARIIPGSIRPEYRG